MQGQAAVVVFEVGEKIHAGTVEAQFRMALFQGEEGNVPAHDLQAALGGDLDDLPQAGGEGVDAGVAGHDDPEIDAVPGHQVGLAQGLAEGVLDFVQLEAGHDEAEVRKLVLEKLTIVGRDKQPVPNPIPWKKVPLYFRRAAINTATAAAKSYLARDKQEQPTGAFTESVTFYKGMYRDFQGNTISLKLWDGEQWQTIGYEPEQPTEPTTPTEPEKPEPENPDTEGKDNGGKEETDDKKTDQEGGSA